MKNIDVDYIWRGYLDKKMQLNMNWVNWFLNENMIDIALKNYYF